MRGRDILRGRRLGRGLRREFARADLERLVLLDGADAGRDGRSVSCVTPNGTHRRIVADVEPSGLPSVRGALHGWRPWHAVAVSRYVMPATEAAGLLGVLDEHDVDVCVGGGWGVDALLGEQTREHSDLDLWLAATALEGLFRVFAEAGLDRIHPWPGDRPWNFVLHDGRTRRVDLHLYETLCDGSIHYGSVLDPFVLPATALSHEGVINGLAVRCEEPSWAISFHTGYLPRPSDHHDVTRLCARYGLQLPPEFR